ncbi:callose synthase [Musa troglodytarum]|uniref:1,3-beta-glucan synthase n=1 Tax=Musa troglodytarum TaxID=320322 RepID=A0A9E7JN87_9LILI|nr:callose synthase [Musa troglodytarum]
MSGARVPRPSRGARGEVRSVYNWERLVRATLQREQLRSSGQGPGGRPAEGIAGAVPPSLVSTNIDHILQAANEIEDEDPNVARILCEQAYTMAQNLDPSSAGRGVLQFKTGLMSVIKQKLAKKDGTAIDRGHDIDILWEFFVRFKRRHRVDDIQKEHERLRETGTFSTEMGVRAVQMKKVYATLKALLDVLAVLAGESASDGVGRLVMEEARIYNLVRKIRKSDATLGGELMPYNIVPVDAPSLTNAISFFPEVRAAISAIGYPSEFPRFSANSQVPQQRNKDMFDLLEFIFGFQKDNIRNQRENVILALANAQVRLGLPDELEPKVDEKAVTEVFRKVLDNYIKWCRYLGTRIAWNSLEALNKNRKVILVSLYYLIWGEAANVRFLPECICYIFHHMAKDLDAILDSQNAVPAKSCICADGSVSYLKQVIFPIYETMAVEAASNNNGKAAHSAWRNYDDFNEYFWSPSCFELKWPLKDESSFLRKPKKWKRTGKTGFVEHRTFLHLYRSFHRLWIFLFLMFQALTIIAFHDGHINLNTFKVVLSVGPAFFILHFIESCLDVLLMFGAYSTTRGFAISRLIIRFIWFGCSSTFLTYLYLKVLDERNNRNSDSTYFRIYTLILGVYVVVRVTFAALVKIPACHSLSDMSDRWPFFQFFKWIYEERYFVGRGLFEKTSSYARYVHIFLVCVFLDGHTYLQVFVCLLSPGKQIPIQFFLLLIKPLVDPTKVIVELNGLQYSWHDLVSKGNRNALTVLSLWAPVFAIYLMDIHIWYTLLSALVGGLLGALGRLGEIRSLDMFHKRFESFPEAFVKNLVSSQMKRSIPNRLPAQDSKDMDRDHAAKFSPFWNEIIKSLREEDYISNREMDLLSIPSNSGTWRLVQWPLFLLTSKIPLAIDLALDCKDTQTDLWNRISKDKYMAYAVKEVYYSMERILLSVVDGEGRLWVEKLFQELNNSISVDSLVVTITLKKLQLVLSRFSALAGLLIRDETPELAIGASKAVHELYDVVTHDFLTSNLSEQLDSWQLLARARNEGRLFSKISWPRDRETREQVKRLYLLLTVKDSATNIPKNLEARRRLQFFANSLFMNLPLPKPVSEMMPFSVFTPYYSETVLYSYSDLRVENEDGISILFYLQKIFPVRFSMDFVMRGSPCLTFDVMSGSLPTSIDDEWENFLERIKSTADAVEDNDNLELRFWASYRGQTLARTVRGMMYYRRALMLQSYLEKRYLGGIEDGYSGADYMSTQGYELSPESRARADLKFTYVVSCQIYGQQKQKGAQEAADIALLMQRNEALRVAFIHVEENALADGTISKEFYSKLVKADANGKDQEIYSIKLPGDPKLGEGKPENQNHAIIFTRGDAIQTIDMNQDNYLEEAMKIRNLLEEFNGKHDLRAPTILGVREHVFTGSVSSLAWFMSNQETSFVTLGQRVLAYPLKVRMHYGHPDVFDRTFHITRGGISKASRVINISEDIYAGFNSTLRQGNITHHEYIQVGKGRDVGLNQIALFEGKVAGGNGEQVLSRDVYRLGQLFDFFRMLSFFFTTVGYYVCTMMTVLTVYIFLYGRVYLALSGLDSAISTKARMLGNTALDAALNAQFLVQIGVFTAVPMIMGFILELGLMKAVFSFVTMQLQLCAVFFTFSLGTRTHYFGRTILHGGAKYKATGRGFVVRHIKFAENYRLYSRSHFVKALEVALLLIVYIAYGYTRNGASSFILLTVSSWILVISWLFAPYIFNPSGFEWQKTVEDFDDWTAWLLYKGGVGIKGENSWESWWDEEQSHIQTLRGKILETILSLRFFIFQYGIVYKLHLTGDDTSFAIYGFSWVVLLLIVMIFKVFTISPKKTQIQLMMRLTQGIAAIGLIAGLVLVVALTNLTIPDLFACVLAIIPTGWGTLCLAITWKGLVQSLGLWDSVREIARMYDAGMGMVIFAPVAFLSWFPFVSTFQSRLLFNQAFSRGLEISLILAGNKANVQA